MYGKAIKYIIPSFNPSATSASPLSTTALHMAHWAEDIPTKMKKNNMDILTLKEYYFNNKVQSLNKPRLR